MGTNYYAIAPACPNPCSHCAQDVEWHIGKNLTMFEAHESSPWGRIESWADWKRVIVQQDLAIRDEYGRHHRSSDFIDAVDATEPAARRRQHQWLLDHNCPLDCDYLDADGFSFHRGDFS